MIRLPQVFATFDEIDKIKMAATITNCSKRDCDGGCFEGRAAFVSRFIGSKRQKLSLGACTLHLSALSAASSKGLTHAYLRMPTGYLM